MILSYLKKNIMNGFRVKETKPNKVFKTDKNFVTKVALRGFAPPQLLRQFCLRQNRFYGLKR